MISHFIWESVLIFFFLILGRDTSHLEYSFSILSEIQGGPSSSCRSRLKPRYVSLIKQETRTLNTCERIAINIDVMVNSEDALIDTLSFFIWKYSREQEQISYGDL